MTKDEALKEALDALKHVEDVYCVTYEEAMIAIESALAEPDTDMAYTIALQRAIEWHCDDKAVPPDVAELCPHHSEKLNETLAQTVQPSQRDLTGPERNVLHKALRRTGKLIETLQPAPQRPWVGLTEWEREAIALECGAMSADWLVFMQAVERALKEKNT